MERRGILALSPQLLLGLFGIKDSVLLDARVNQFGDGLLHLVISGPSMPECCKGEHPRTVTLEELAR